MTRGVRLRRNAIIIIDDDDALTTSNGRESQIARFVILFRWTSSLCRHRRQLRSVQCSSRHGLTPEAAANRQQMLRSAAPAAARRIALHSAQLIGCFCFTDCRKRPSAYVPRTIAVDDGERKVCAAHTLQSFFASTISQSL